VALHQMSHCRNDESAIVRDPLHSCMADLIAVRSPVGQLDKLKVEDERIASHAGRVWLRRTIVPGTKSLHDDDLHFQYRTGPLPSLLMVGATATRSRGAPQTTVSRALPRSQ
jgi:hypothetical protein